MLGLESMVVVPLAITASLAGVPAVADGAEVAAFEAELSAVPESTRAERLSLVWVQGVSRRRAEALMSLAPAALWVEQAEEILLLGAGHPARGPAGNPSRSENREEVRDAASEDRSRSSSTSRTSGVADRASFTIRSRVGLSGRASRGSHHAKAEGTATVGEFLAAAEERFPDLREGRWGSYLLKTPTSQLLPDSLAGRSPSPAPNKTVLRSVELSEGFEDDPFSGRWERWDSSGGQYTWTTTTCDARRGTRSADSIRGGTLGFALTCDATAPPLTDTWLYDTQCEDLTGANQAWLDLYLSMDVTGGSDELRVYFKGPDERLYGWMYTGLFPSWWHLTFNLREWSVLGDLTAQPCNLLYFVFSTGSAGEQGIGARLDDVTIRADAAADFICYANASPASGPAPLTVGLSTSAIGGTGAVDYFWLFGDGGSSSEQNPTHTYSEPGTYSASQIAADDLGWTTCTTIVQVTDPSACVVDCSAQVPATGAAGASVRFEGSATASGCTGSPSYAWTFGDGGSATGAVVDHTYANTGSFPWSLTVTADGATCTRNGTITIDPASPDLRYLVATVAHALGFGDSRWRSDVAAVNNGLVDATLRLTHLGPSGQVERTRVVAAGTAVEWRDILVSVFDYADDASVSGALHINCNVPLAITSRTYNESETGTYGQYLPAVRIEDCLEPGQVALLPQVSSDDGFYTNIGVLNTGDGPARVDVRLRDQAGDAVGQTVTIDLEAGSWRQANDVFASAGAGSHSSAYATLEIASGDSVWGYASVVDRHTKDPTTIPMMTAAASPVTGTRLSALWPEDRDCASLAEPAGQTGSRTASAPLVDPAGEEHPTSGPAVPTEPSPRDLSQHPRFRAPRMSSTSVRTGPRPSELRLLALADTVDLGSQLGSWHDGASIEDGGRGHPWFVFSDPVDLAPVFSAADATGIPRLVDLLQHPRGLSSADFDEDGVTDLVTTFGADDRGVITLHGGNVDLIHSHTAEALDRKARGTFTDAPFLTPARVLPVPLVPHLVGAGDLDADDHQDLVLAEHGGEALLLLPGDGYGGFGPPRWVPLSGAVTALAVGEVNRRDGLADVVVAVSGPGGAHLLVFEGPDGALASRPESIALPEPAEAIILGRLDGDALHEVVALCGDRLVVAQGRDRRLSVAHLPVVEVPDVVVASVELETDAVAMALGNLLGGRERELAVLDDAGTVHLLDAAELTAGRLVHMGQRVLGAAAGADTVSLLVTRISSLPRDDLVVVDGSGRRLHLVATEGQELKDDSGKTLRNVPVPEPTVLEVADEATAVLPMRLNGDALADLVVLTRGSSPWAVLPTRAARGFVVYSSGDEPDADGLDGFCLTEAGTCTLRAAIEQANRDGVAASITFSVSSIRPESEHRSPRVPITIDGTSAGMVELDGSAAGTQASGFLIQGSDSVIRGMAIHSFAQSGIQLVGSTESNNLVAGCFIGTDRTGSVSRPNQAWGILVNSDTSVVGGTAAPDRNVIAGATGLLIAGVFIRYAEGAQVLGNHIGTDVDGTQAFPNGHGVDLENCTDFTVGSPAAGAGNLLSGNEVRGMVAEESSGGLIQGNLIGTNIQGTSALGNHSGVGLYEADLVTVGGSTPAARNILSGNTVGVGVSTSDSTNCEIRGNFIGTDIDGRSVVANNGHGVQVGGARQGSHNVTVQGNLVSGNGSTGISVINSDTADNLVVENLVGTDVSGEQPLPNGTKGVTVGGASRTFIAQNTIAFNEFGVTASHSTSTGNQITENSIHSNSELGIDIGSWLVTPNDPGDGDEGANRQQNFPVLSLSPDGSIVHGTLDSRPGTTFTIELFANDECDPSGHGEGQEHLGSTDVTTNGSGFAEFTFDLPLGRSNFTATATDSDGNTSEFSACASAPTGTVTSITPEVAPNTITDSGYFREPLDLRIVGEGFKRHDETTVRLVGEHGGAEPTVTVLYFVDCDDDGVCNEIAAQASGFQGLQEGKYDVVVTNHDGSRSEGADLFYVSSLYVHPIEVNQARAMDCDPSRPCVADHNTAIKVRITCNGTGCEQGKGEVAGRLYVWREGAAYPGSPFTTNIRSVRPNNPTTLEVRPTPQTGSAYSARERFVSRDALTFFFNDRHALPEGTYDFAFVVNPRPDSPWLPPAASEPDVNAHLVRRRSFSEFGASDPGAYVSIAAFVDENLPEARAAQAIGQIHTFDDFMRASYPISHGHFEFHFAGTADFPLTYAATWMNLSYWRFWFNRDLPAGRRPFTHAVLFTDPGWMGQEEGLTPCGGDQDTDWGCAYSSAVVKLPELAENVQPTLAHEMGHMFALGDTYTSGKAMAWYSNEPGLECRELIDGCPVEEGNLDTVMGTASTSEFEHLKVDFMGTANRANAWVDNRTWDYLYDHFMPTSRPKRRPVPPQTDSWLAVLGRITADGTASFDPFMPLDEHPGDSDPPAGPYSVVIEDAGGTPLAEVSFDLPERYSEVDPLLEQGFSLVLPYSDQATRVALRHGDVELAERTISANPPTVTVVSPNGGETLSGVTNVTWTASDPDGDALTFAALYAADGETFSPVAVNLSQTSFAWDTSLAPAASAGRLQVVASDGVNTGSDTSDGTFTIAAKDPLVAIINPADGAVLPADTTVILEGSALDLEDGVVPDDRLSFTSSLDGALGSGARVTHTLSQGVHTITLTATDSDGMSGSASIAVTVDAELAPLTATIHADPPGGPPPLEVNLEGSATGGVPPYQFSWALGDGAVAGGETAEHVYTDVGTYPVTLVVADSQLEVAETEVTITVAVGDINHLYVIPTVAHALGFGTSRWRSDVAVVNDSATSAALTVTYLGGATPSIRGAALAAGATVEWADLLVTLFGHPDDASTSGSLHIGSDIPVAITSRTYNQSDEGTYGQFLPAVLSVDTLTAGEVGVLPQVKADSGFYTNIGVVNTGDQTCMVRVRLFGAGGSQVGADTTIAVEPGRWRQANDIFASSGAGTQSTAFATVEVLTVGGTAWAYASVVDRSTKDPTTIPVLRVGD